MNLFVVVFLLHEAYFAYIMYGPIEPVTIPSATCMPFSVLKVMSQSQSFSPAQPSVETHSRSGSMGLLIEPMQPSQSSLLAYYVLLVDAGTKSLFVISWGVPVAHLHSRHCHNAASEVYTAWICMTDFSAS